MILWPLRSPPQTSWSDGSIFAAPRSKNGKQVRYHAGLDLKAADGDDVIAPEDLAVVDVDRGWDGTARATLVHTASGHALLLGCTNAAVPEGTKLKAGEVVAKIGHYTRVVEGVEVRSSMLHLQIYDAPITALEANQWQSWPVDSPRPPHLIDPLVYLEGAVIPAAPAEDALTLDVPCPLVDGLPVCLVSHVELWAKRLAAAVDEALAVYMAAGWAERPHPPDAIVVAVDMFNVSADVLDTYKDGQLVGTHDQQVRALTQAIGDCDLARAVFAIRPSASKSGSSSGAALAVGAVVTFAVVGAVVYASTRKGRW